MTDERLIIAIGRLDRALARLESIADRGPAEAADAADLVRRHEKLRARTQQAVDALDRLIGER